MSGILWFTVGLTFALLGHLIAWHFGRAAGMRNARHKTPGPTNQRRTSQYLPGDLVSIALPPNDISDDSHNGKGVVVYGPDGDDEPGWIVSSVPGSLRCVADELTMITQREDRKA